MKWNEIVILTGAGISAESGLGTFRDEDGLWAQHRIEDVATPEGFARNPKLVHDFYNARRAQDVDALPNAAHKALAKLQARHSARVTIVTQNVDSLHERGGAHDVMHMHGSLAMSLCAACGHRWDSHVTTTPDDLCPACMTRATRPDVVWFGEMPYDMDDITERLHQADLFVAIGTSGNVYPAAGFVMEADRSGAHTIEINKEPSAVVSAFAETRFGRASELVPLWVEDVLAE